MLRSQVLLDIHHEAALLDLALLLHDVRYAQVFMALLHNKGRLLELEAAAGLTYPVVSIDRFSRLFCQRVGMPYRTAAFTIRMELSAHAVARTYWRMSDIAEVFGYSELKKWDASFAMHFAKSPTQYRAAFELDPAEFAHGCRFLPLSLATMPAIYRVGGK